MAQQTGTESSERTWDTGGPGGDEEAEVQSFLDQFARALIAGDGRTIAQLWETPALVVHDENVRVVNTPQEVEQFFAGAKDQYNQAGITDTRAEIARLDWPTERIAIVEVRWPYLDASGQERGYETSTYTLRRNDRGALKLRTIVMHGVGKAD